MKIARSSVVAALILMAGAAGMNSAMAQEDQRFFGRWEPGSRSAGGWPLIVEPGRIYYINDKGEIVYEENYQIIRDFGDRVVIKIWPLKPIIEGASTDPYLAVISVENRPPDRHLYIEYCGGGEVTKFFFSTDDPDEVWARIMAWSKKEGDFPKILSHLWYSCLFDLDKITLLLSSQSGGMLFFQKLKKE